MVRHPWVAVTIGYGTFVAIVYVSLASGRVGQEFMPQQDTGIVAVTVEGAPGTRLEETDRLLRQIESIVADQTKYPEVRYYSATAGSRGAGVLGATGRGGQYGAVSITLKPKRERKARGWRSDEQLANDLRGALARLPSFNIQVNRSGGHGPGGGGVELALIGPDREQLERVGMRIVQIASKMKGLRYVELSAKPGRPEVRARVDRRRTADQGLNAAAVAMTLRAAIEGDTSSKYREGGDEYNVRVQLADVDRHSVTDVGDVFVGLSRTGQIVRLRDVAQLYPGTGPSLTQRLDRERQVVVSAQLEGIVSSEGQRLLMSAGSEVPHPGVTIQWAGMAEMQRENFAYMFQAMGLAGALVFMIVAALYTNLLQPFNVAFTVPMALGGGLLGLLVTGGSLSIVSMIGMIMLMGLVGKNAILLVDYTNTLRARGLGRTDALLEAGPTRMRPILMTTLATVFGMLPIALSEYLPFMAEGSEFRAPMANVVIAGMLVSTLLSLLMTPSFYAITDDIQELLYKLWRWVTGGGRRGGGGA